MTDLRTEDRFPDGALAAAWEELIADDPAATIFHSARFLRRWCHHLRGGCELRLRFLEDAGRLVGVVPEVREDATIHFAGGAHVTDYLGPIARPEDRDRVVDVWFSALEEDDGWRTLVAGGIVEDAGWPAAIAKRAEAAGWSVDEPTLEDVCPVVDLEGGWEGYLSRISSKQRHEIRRKARKLAREAGAVRLVAVPSEDLHDDLDTFIAMHRTSDGEKGEFFDRPDMPEFFHALVDEFGSDGLVRLHRLDVEGEPAAMTVSLVEHGSWGLYNSAYRQDLRDLAPGMVLVGELIRLAGEEGCDEFDLLRGAEPYKYRFGATDRRLLRLTVSRR